MHNAAASASGLFTCSKCFALTARLLYVQIFHLRLLVLAFSCMVLQLPWQTLPCSRYRQVADRTVRHSRCINVCPHSLLAVCDKMMTFLMYM